MSSKRRDIKRRRPRPLLGATDLFSPASEPPKRIDGTALLQSAVAELIQQAALFVRPAPGALDLGESARRLPSSVELLWQEQLGKFVEAGTIFHLTDQLRELSRQMQPQLARLIRGEDFPRSWRQYIASLLLQYDGARFVAAENLKRHDVGDANRTMEAAVIELNAALLRFGDQALPGNLPVPGLEDELVPFDHPLSLELRQCCRAMLEQNAPVAGEGMVSVKDVPKGHAVDTLSSHPLRAGYAVEASGLPQDFVYLRLRESRSGRIYIAACRRPPADAVTVSLFQMLPDELRGKLVTRIGVDTCPNLNKEITRLLRELGAN